MEKNGEELIVRLIEEVGTSADKLMLVAWRANLHYHPSSNFKRRFPYCMRCEEKKKAGKS